MTTHLSARVIKEFVIQVALWMVLVMKLFPAMRLFADEVHRGLYHLMAPWPWGPRPPHQQQPVFLLCKTQGAG